VIPVRGAGYYRRGVRKDLQRCSEVLAPVGKKGTEYSEGKFASLLTRRRILKAGDIFMAGKGQQ